MCQNCCCVRRSYVTTTIGLLIGLLELILAAVYNFHAFGFIFAALLISISIAQTISIKVERNAKIKEGKDGEIKHAINLVS